MVDDRPDHARLGHQLPDAQHPCGGRPDRPQRPAHHHATIFVDRRSLPGRHHGTANLRLRPGCAWPQNRFRHIRRRMVARQHGALLRNSWQAFAWLRGLLGFSEGSANPAGMKATAEWFPARERGLAGGVYNIGASVGSMLAPPLVAWAILSYNWRAAFVITGSLGLVWVVLWLLLYQSPDRHPALSGREKAFISSGQEKHLQSDGSRPSLCRILAQRNFWGIALPRFLADPTWGTLSFWLPLYLSSVRHMDLKHIAMFAWMPFLAADFGCVFGGQKRHPCE